MPRRLGLRRSQGITRTQPGGTPLLRFKVGVSRYLMSALPVGLILPLDKAGSKTPTQRFHWAGASSFLQGAAGNCTAIHQLMMDLMTSLFCCWPCG